VQIGRDLSVQIDLAVIGAIGRVLCGIDRHHMDDWLNPPLRLMSVDRMRSTIGYGYDRPISPNQQPVGAGLAIDSTAAINHRTKPALPHQ
jgi:hypothetical protein